MDDFGGSMARSAPVAWLLAIAAVLAVACGEPPAEVTVDPSAGPVAPQVTCLGVVAAKCTELVLQIEEQSFGAPLVAIRIVCSAPPCVERSGEVKVDAAYADGRRESSGSAWGTVGGGGAPPPQPAVAPSASPPG
jgi:hypothetical protein